MLYLKRYIIIGKACYFICIIIILFLRKEMEEAKQFYMKRFRHYSFKNPSAETKKKTFTIEIVLI